MIKQFINFFLNFFGLTIIKYTDKEHILENKFNNNFIHFLEEVRKFNLDLNKLIDFKKLSNSQSFQDLFVIAFLNKKKGIFIEAGACDGKFLSNTYLLERELNWNGVLVEPNSFFWKDLVKNRNTNIFKGAISKKNGKMEFVECTAPELSYLSTFNQKDKWSNVKKTKEIKNIDTLSLKGLLSKFSLGSSIDYLSLDLEGGELEILKSIDFNEIRIKLITVEHNFTSNREQIYNLLKTNGFKRVMKNISDQDDWYINSNEL